MAQQIEDERCIIYFPGGIFHVLLQESKQEKVGQVGKSLLYLQVNRSVLIRRLFLKKTLLNFDLFKDQTFCC